jgi:DNA-binding XRE family transcriptional regulator
MADMTATNTGVSEIALSLNRPRLDELRRAHGIKTEAELARRIGVTPSTLYRISMGQVQPSTGFVARVKLAFPMASLDSLFTAKRLAPPADEVAA